MNNQQQPAALQTEVERLRDELNACCELKRSYQEREAQAVEHAESLRELLRESQVARNARLYSAGLASATELLTRTTAALAKGQSDE